MTTTPTAGGEGQAASMNQSMTLMMPLMFGFFSLNFATGLSFYFIISNIIGLITQGFISGWDKLLFWKDLNLASLPFFGRQPAPSPAESKPAPSEKGTTSGSKKGRKKKRRRKR
jgi:YidC/Oxa1 family membrane protein insertase